MKRKAPTASAYEQPAKLSKNSTKATIKEVIELTKEKTIPKTEFEPLRLGSFRQRKAPSWLSSYVTNSTVKETTKPSTPKEQPLAPKIIKNTEKQNLKKEPKIKKDDALLLKKQKTIKLANLSNSTSKPKLSYRTPSKPAPQSKNSTVILSDYDIESGKSLTEEKSFAVLTDDKKSSLSSALPSVQNQTKEDPITSSDDTLLSLGPNGDIIKESKLDLKEDNAPEAMGKPTMLEVVICISTSGAMQDYLEVLQDKTREMIWRLQSLIPNLRIGVFAHTQGGIHDDKAVSRSSALDHSALDHNYIRTAGHSGTKWLDLGATYSQICAFVGSLESEATVYPDYVQDNLEMALWKLQRCMSWSSCSYRTVIMLGRGRPNRTSFYLQREHWRGWIRSALEITKKVDIPVIDWELEAKLLAQMGIHVFTIQALPRFTTEEEEDEGSVFFRRVAEITNGQHIRLNDASKLVDILVGICCACHGPDLLQEHRNLLRDENDGVLPEQLRDIFISLQLHSKRRSLSTMPTVIGDLSLVRRQLDKTDSNGNRSGSDDEMSEDEKLDDNELPDKLQDSMVTSTECLTTANLKYGMTKPVAKSSLSTNKKIKPVKAVKIDSKKTSDKKKSNSLPDIKKKRGRKPLDKSTVKTAVKVNSVKDIKKVIKSVSKSAAENKKKLSLKNLQKVKATAVSTKSTGSTKKTKLKPTKPSVKDASKPMQASKSNSKQVNATRTGKGKEVSKKLKVGSKPVAKKLSSNMIKKKIKS
ncbi:hypothetical protein Btru_068355 [Bulinus truncatus]|nr:hypothetical protein Btru_068355 [Bulinus truncatus]